LAKFVKFTVGELALILPIGKICKIQVVIGFFDSDALILPIGIGWETQ